MKPRPCRCGCWTKSALTNLVHEDQPRVRLVVAGNRVLEERFASPKLDSFSQRIVARCYLESLNRTETQDYIHALVAAVGAKGPRLFPAESCNSVYKATDGVPRLINQVCDHALLLAYAGGKRQVEPGLVEEAWADLQQLPTPWNEQSDSDRNIIEFGGLDDEPAEAGKADDAKAFDGDDEPAASDQQAADAEQAEAKADEEPSTPSLHVVPDIDESEAADLEPAEQLQRIQHMLADVEQEFCPAGTIGPEVELVFNEPEHPFRESFQEEEVIRDRYATRGEAIAAGPSEAEPFAEHLRRHCSRPRCARRWKRRPRRPWDHKTLAFRPGLRRTSRRRKRRRSGGARFRRCRGD